MKKNTRNQSYWLGIILDDLNHKLDESSKKRLEEWIHLSTQNQSYYNQIKEIWLTMDVLNEAEAIDSDRAFLLFQEKICFTEEAEPIQKKKKVFLSFPFIRKTLKYAAIILPFMVGVFFVTQYFSTPQEPAIMGVSVPRGSKSELTLKDGSKIMLNSDSKLRVDKDFGRKNRLIYLSGEAYLEVARNEELPFIVNTKYIDVQVLGTQFNISAPEVEENIKVTLESGSVQLRFNQAETLILKPSEQATYNIHTKQMHIDKANMKRVMAWRDNHLFFSGETFEQIARALEKQYNVKIHIHNEKLREQQFFGDFTNNETIEQILDVMSSTNNWHYEIHGNSININ